MLLVTTASSLRLMASRVELRFYLGAISLLSQRLSMQDLDAVPAAVERALQRLRDEGSP